MFLNTYAQSSAVSVIVLLCVDSTINCLGYIKRHNVFATTLSLSPKLPLDTQASDVGVYFTTHCEENVCVPTSAQEHVVRKLGGRS